MSNQQLVTEYQTANVTLTLTGNNFKTPLAVTVGNVIVTPAQVENMLITFGEYYAIRLAGVLDVLEAYNPAAVFSIASILEPYMAPIPEMNFSFPPKSSREVIFDVTRKGKVEPTIYLDDSL